MTRKFPERTALFPGSFNPFTRGHMSVVERALPLFDHIVIGIGCNFGKPGSMEAAQERADAIAALFASEPRVSVTVYGGLTADLCRQLGARFILRGVRSVADFEYERNLADVNREIGNGIETVVLYTLPADAAISSSMVRELESYGADVTPFLPTPHSNSRTK